MKWLCRFWHKWYYYTNQTPLRVGQLLINKRRCKRCHMIETKSLVTGNWHKVIPTKEERREINLKKLKL